MTHKPEGFEGFWGLLHHWPSGDQQHYHFERFQIVRRLDAQRWIVKVFEEGQIPCLQVYDESDLLDDSTKLYQHHDDFLNAWAAAKEELKP